MKFSLVAALAASAAAAPLPLNINLGAYSPALVVGDGEISFGGGEGKPGGAAAKVVNTLQGSSVSKNEAVAHGEAVADRVQEPALSRASLLDEPAFLPVPGVTKKLEARQGGGLTKRQAGGFDRALLFAEAALTKGPKVLIGTEEAGVGIIVEPRSSAAATT